MLVTDVFQMSREQRDALTDEQIRELRSGIQYYEPMYMDDAEKTRQWDILRNELYPRVKALRAQPQAPRAQRAVETMRCECGHTVARSLVMSTSSGSSCPDCYDRMSN